VLALVEQGLRNKEIADRLFVSAKTIDHHVAAILRKLGVHTRGEAGAAARRLGLAPAAIEPLHDRPVGGDQSH
jgi:DNA-binding NarL/FixJ family response regulator